MPGIYHRTLRLLALLLLIPTTLIAGPPAGSIDLGGRWRFALDPEGVGELRGWHVPGSPSDRNGLMGTGASWDQVTVPHTWSVDPRYYHTGSAWYRRTFSIPADLKGQTLRLAFDGVFYRARIFVNGRLVGQHEGGYTPFNVDITSAARPGEENLIAVEVNNRLDLTTIPGARPGNAPSEQLNPWWNYGGIVRDVYLVATPPLYVENTRIVADPDLAKGTASVDLTVWVSNNSAQTRTGTLNLALRRDGATEVLEDGTRNPALRQTVKVSPFVTEHFSFRVTLPKNKVDLWGLDHPTLYVAEATLRDEVPLAGVPAEHQYARMFGIRKIEIRNAQFLLNGEPIYLGGANRHIDHPSFGLSEPDSLIALDMGLMKEAHMELQRMHHYPPAPGVYEWADRNGMLIIAEAGNWQLAPSQLDDPLMRAKWQIQMRDMMARDWNHPSVVAWSVGNEYQSETPAGMRWTHDMVQYVKSLDPSRPVTYAGLGGTLSEGGPAPEARSHSFVDFVSANLYTDEKGLAAALDRAHKWWPDKPVFISEWGRRDDQVADQADRIRSNRAFIDAIRGRDWVIGASIWTYNDYRSRYPGTNPNGFRPWGVVDEDRKPRESYYALRDEYAPATWDGEVITSASGFTTRLTVTARPDFPRRTLRHHTARLRVFDAAGKILFEEKRPVETLSPGASATVRFEAPAARITGAATVQVDLVSPTGFSATTRSWKLK